MTATETLDGEVGPPTITDTTQPASPPRRRPRLRERSLRRRLLAPFTVAGAFYVVLAVGDRLPAVDGLAYFEAGRNLLGGDGFTRYGQQELHFPPLVPVSLRLLELITGSEMAALGIWNVGVSLALVGVVVALAHRLWRDERVTVATAWLAGAMTGLGPLFFRYGSGSEHVALALLLAAVLVSLDGDGDLDGAPSDGGPGGRDDTRPRHRRPVRMALCGLLVGVAYLARPETLLPGLLVGAVVVATAWHRRGSSDPTRTRTSATGAAAFLLGIAVLVTPYAAYLHRHTGSWSLTAKSQDVSIHAWRAVAEGDRRERDSYVYALNDEGTGIVSGTRSLTSLAADDPVAWLAIVRTNVGQVATTYLAPSWGPGPAWQLVPAPLLVPAAAELWRRRRRRSTWLLVGVGTVPLVVSAVFFSLPRYLVAPTAVVTMFAAAGLARWTTGLDRRRARLLVGGAVVLVALSSFAAVRPLLPGQTSADPVRHQRAAEWIAAHTPPDARVMTRSFHVQAYADRPIVALPVADYGRTLTYARTMGVRYVVIDSRSPLYVQLRDGGESPGMRLVAEFGRSNAILIYRLDPAPPPSSRPPTPLGYVGDS